MARKQKQPPAAVVEGENLYFKNTKMKSFWHLRLSLFLFFLTNHMYMKKVTQWLKLFFSINYLKFFFIHLFIHSLFRLFSTINGMEKRKVVILCSWLVFFSLYMKIAATRKKIAGPKLFFVVEKKERHTQASKDWMINDHHHHLQ